MIVGADRVVVVDFGLARAGASDTSSDDDAAGTLVYRAPGGTTYVSVSFLAEQVSVSGANRCIFGGTATLAF